MIGVCAACLKEKLLVLASKQGRLSPAGRGHGAFSRIPSLKPSVAMPKVFALGSSLLHRLESRHQKPGEDSDGGSIASADGNVRSQNKGRNILTHLFYIHPQSQPRRLESFSGGEIIET